MAGLNLHGYYSPTLVDGLTMPHNPGVEYDIFGHWNQLRTERNREAFYGAKLQIQRPVNDWSAAGNSTRQYTVTSSGATQDGDVVTITTTANADQVVVGSRVSVLGMTDDRYDGVFTVTEKPSATTFRYVHATHSDLPASGGGTAAITVGSPERGPAFAQGWDDWGPFYGQTILAQIGVDSSTVEVPGSNCQRPLPDRRIGKKAHYVAIYSSADFWVDNRAGYAPRPARALPPRRRRRAVEPERDRAGPGARRARLRRLLAQLDVRLPQGVRDPLRRRAAQRDRGQPARPVPARQRDLGSPAPRPTSRGTAPPTRRVPT